MSAEIVADPRAPMAFRVLPGFGASSEDAEPLCRNGKCRHSDDHHRAGLLQARPWICEICEEVGGPCRW